MRRLVHGAALVFGAATALPWACTADDAVSEEDGQDDPPAAPSIELVVPEIELSAAQLGEISLPVTDLRPNTRVEIDGRAWLPGGTAPATLVDEELRIPLGGAMVVGVHELRLSHQVGTKVLESEPVAVNIVESQPAGLVANLAPEVVGVGDRLVGHGQGPEATFGVIVEADERMSIRAGQWSAAGFDVEVPGVVASEGLRSSIDLAIATTAPERWVVVAWMAAGGTAVYGRIAPVDVYGEPTAEPSEPLLLWSLEDPEQVASLGPHEVVSIDGVAVLDRMVVIGLDAPRDVEQATIGDRLLVARLLAAGATVGAPVLLRGSDSRDLDLPGDARQWTIGPSTALSVRIGLGFTGLLELASNGLPLLREDAGQTGAVASASTWMTSADGAFGSRHVFAIAEGDEVPRVQVLPLDRWSAPNPEQPTAGLVELPAWPTASPELGNFDGVPTLVLPMGSEVDVVTVRSTGAVAQIESISGLRCDALALANPGTDGIADTLPLACLLGGELRLGFVGAE